MPTSKSGGAGAAREVIAKKIEKLPHGSLSLNNKPIIITFLAMEKSNPAFYNINAVGGGMVHED